MHGVKNLGAQQEVITFALFRRGFVQNLQRVLGGGRLEDGDGEVQAHVRGRRVGRDGRSQEFSRWRVLLKVEERFSARGQQVRVGGQLVGRTKGLNRLLGLPLSEKRLA